MNKKLSIGLALGSGSARGWAHIGIIRALAELGITPNIVCGTSVGALIGASFVTGNLDKLEKWACSLTKFEAVKFIDINLGSSGFVDIKRFQKFLNTYVGSDDLLIENCEKKFAAVATDLETGREVWLMKDSIIKAVWSSMSMPGLFPAINNNKRWLVDGGLVNPVPVSACRALGADIVIAVNLNGDLMGRHSKPLQEKPLQNSHNNKNLTELVKEYGSSLFSNNKSENQAPGLLDAIASSINITQDRITRGRLAGDPPDIVLTPKLAGIGIMELYRAEEAIQAGRDSVERMLPELNHLLETTNY